MRYAAITFFFILIPFLSFAQNQTVVSGVVVNEDGEPLPSASVAVYDSAMSKIITGTATTNKGFFEIKLDPGNYVVKITFVSYKPYQQEVELSAGEKLSLGRITLQSTSESLATLYVRAEQSRMTLSFDKGYFM